MPPVKPAGYVDAGDKPSTQCKGCHRIVYVTDVDAAGRCCFCQPTTATAESSAK